MKTKKNVTINGKTYTLRKSIFTTNTSPVHISDQMGGKMEGVPSISTSCLVNPYCLARMKRGDAVCKACFAERILHGRKGNTMNPCLVDNFYLFNDQILDVKLLPRFYSYLPIIRIESFGDVASVTQAINYINICKVNPSNRFAAWTKNDNFWKQAFELEGKPENLCLVHSSLCLNESETPVNPEIIDHVFTVYDKETAEFYGGESFINCGARSCLNCQRCYKKPEEPGFEFSIRELLK